MAKLLLWSMALAFITLIQQTFQQTSQKQSYQQASSQQQPLVGAILTSFDQQGQQRRLKIESISPDPQDPEQELSLYTVLYQQADGHWQNLCQSDLEGVSKAIPLSGRWNETGHYIDDASLTFACSNGAIAKCVRWGYKPWKNVQGLSLRGHHQACIRMVRADYCGNGNSHTRVGTPIDIYDPMKINQQNSQSGMVFEAAWGIDGALYLNRPRFQSVIAQLQQECPEKLAKMMHPQVNDFAYRPELDHRTDQRSAQPLLFNDSFIQAIP